MGGGDRAEAMDDRLKLRHLRVFLAIAEAGTVTGAARKLNSAQPAVSRTLRELEEIVGRPLFQRTSRGLVRTEAGDELYRFATVASGQLEEGIARASGLDEAASVRIGALPNLLASLLPPVVRRFKEESPRTVFRIETGTIAYLLAHLRRGNIDFVMGRMADPDSMQGLSFEYIWEEELPFAARTGHPLAGRRKITLREVDDYPVILPLPGTVIRTEVDRAMAERGSSGFSNIIETVSVEFGRKLLQLTDAIFVFPVNALAEEFDSGRIVRLDLEIAPIRSPVGITVDPVAQPSGASARVLELLREAARAHSS